jgi:hypothetical protein
LLGCGSDDAAEATADGGVTCTERAEVAPNLELHTVTPQQTDPDLPAAPLELWLEPPGKPIGKLFVFLGGLGSKPGDYDLILRHAAASGHHAIGLAYTNVYSDSVMDLCANDPSPDCTGDIRREVITGVDSTSLVDVDATHSIEHRLAAMLQYLGWSQFLSSAEPRWDDIVIAGHSLGGGNAMMIAQMHSVERALTIAQPFETAGWTLDPTSSVPDRLYGFAHTLDTFAASGEMMTAWDNLGLPGVPTSVDDDLPPYGGSHQLVTSRSVTSEHISVAVDAAFAPVWCYMTGP